LKGLELSRRFFFEAVQPILERRFPEVQYAAALIGYGSEVVGLDDEMSQDHEWGPRVQLFTEQLNRAPEMERILADELPRTFAGFPTNFGPTGEPGTVRMTATESGPVAHRVQTFKLADYLRVRIGVDPRDGFTAADWLVTPSQQLLELTAGDVFVDPIGDLTRVRELLAWYPHDVWLLAMAGHWKRIAEFEHLHGATLIRSDELGSRLLAAALVRDLMRLGFLQHRRYAPYPKWFGAAYANLDLPEREALATALRAGGSDASEDALVVAYEIVARRQNELAVAEEVDASVRQFWGRPIRVISADRFVEALRKAISDPDVQAVDHETGALDAVSDNTQLLTYPVLWRRVVDLYDRA
jgi:hypothetical protein